MSCPWPAVAVCPSHRLPRSSVGIPPGEFRPRVGQVPLREWDDVVPGTGTVLGLGVWYMCKFSFEDLSEYMCRTGTYSIVRHCVALQYVLVPVPYRYGSRLQLTVCSGKRWDINAGSKTPMKV
jgi:hypothetical protein